MITVDEFFDLADELWPGRVRVSLSDGNVVGIAGPQDYDTLGRISAAAACNCPDHGRFGDPSKKAMVKPIDARVLLDFDTHVTLRYFHISHSSAEACTVVAVGSAETF